MTAIVINSLVDNLQVDLLEVDSATGLPTKIDFNEDFLALALQNALSEIRLVVDIGGPLLTDVDDQYEGLIRVWAGYNILLGHWTKISKEFKFDDQNISVDKQEKQRTYEKILKAYKSKRNELIEAAKTLNSSNSARFGIQITSWED